MTKTAFVWQPERLELFVVEALRWQTTKDRVAVVIISVFELRSVVLDGFSAYLLRDTQ